MSRTAAKSIGTRILLYAILISFFSIIITGAAVLILARNELGENIAERNLQIAKQVSSKISLYINDSMSELKTVGEIAVPLDGNSYLQQIVLENLTLNTNRYRAICLADSEGNVRVSSHSESSDECIFSPGFISDVARNGRSISGIELSKDGLPEVFLGLLIPHFGTSNGIIGARLNLRDIWEIIDSINVGRQGRASLFAENGTVLSHSDKQQVFGRLSSEERSTLNEVPPEGETEIRSTGAGTRMLSVYARVPEAGWIVRIDQPVEEAFLPQRQVFLNALILILIGIVLAYISSILIAQELSEPLKQLVEGTKIVGSGDFDYRLEYDTRDEIGMLAEAFNEMASELKANSEALRKSEERYRIIAENSSDIIFVLDEKGCFTFLNRQAVEVSGYEREMFLGRHISSVPLENYSRRALALMKSPAVLSRLTEREFEVLLTSKEQNRLTLDVKFVQTTDDDGRTLFLGVAHDMTEKRKMQRQIMQSEKLTSLGDLVAGVAHELNNPLTSVLGYAELLRSGSEIAEPVKQDLEKIIFESTRAKRIIQNLLVFARKNPPEKKTVQINDIIESVLLVREFEMSANRIEIERMLDSSLPPVTVDPAQIRQVFLNIVTNAIQILKNTESERCLTVATSSDSSSVKIVFQDTGPGIALENVNKVFDPFFTTLDVGKGIGLGLSISYGIIEEHGGKISVLTRRGEGTQFVIELPLEQMTRPPVRRLEMENSLHVGARRVLIIEDEDSIRSFLSRVFQKDGCTVDTAASWIEAVSLLEKTAYEVIISGDFQIPGCDKWGAYAWLRDHRPELVSRMIFMTGDTFGPDVQSFIRETRITALVKPFTVEELKQKVSLVVPSN